MKWLQQIAFWFLFSATVGLEAAQMDNLMTEQELATNLMDSCAVDAIRTLDIAPAEVQQWRSTFEGTFDLTTSLEKNPTVTVLYRIPLNVQGQPLPSAENMVMYCSPVVPARPPALGEISPLSALMKPFSDEQGCTVFSLEFETDFRHINDQKETYFYAGPEWVNLILRAKSEIAKRYHFRSRKLLLYGESLGGTFAERLAVNMADEVAGIAILNTPEITPPTRHTNIAWMVNVNRGDSGKSVNQELVNNLRSTATPCVHVVTPPPYRVRGNLPDGKFYHAISGETQQVAMLFLKGVVKQESTNGDNEVTRWPYIRDSKRPLVFQRNDAQSAAAIPTNQREYLPSRECAELLQHLPVPTMTAAIKLDGVNQTIRCTASVTANGKPKGIIIYGQQYSFSNLADSLNDINFLSEHGYLVLTAQDRKDSDVGLSATINFLAKNKTLSSLPWAFVGFGQCTTSQWTLLLKHPNIKPIAQVPIGFKATNLLDESKWPVGAMVRWPMLFIYDQKDMTATPNEATTLQAVSDLKAVKTFVEAQKLRKQIANICFIGLKRKSDEQIEQKTIETALDFIDGAISNRLR